MSEPTPSEPTPTDPRLRELERLASQGHAEGEALSAKAADTSAFWSALWALAKKAGSLGISVALDVLDGVTEEQRRELGGIALGKLAEWLAARRVKGS